MIIVVFGLTLGMVLEIKGLATPGLAEFPVRLTGATTINRFDRHVFRRWTKLRNTFWRPKTPKPDDVVLNDEEVILGTKGTQLIFLTCFLHSDRDYFSYRIIYLSGATSISSVPCYILRHCCSRSF